MKTCKNLMVTALAVMMVVVSMMTVNAAAATTAGQNTESMSLEERINKLELTPKTSPNLDGIKNWYDFTRVERIRDDKSLSNYEKMKAVYIDIAEQTKGFSCTSHASLLGTAYEMLGFKVYGASGGVRTKDGKTPAAYDGRMGFVKEGYADLLGMEQPVLNVYGGDYNIYDQQMYSIGFYEGAGSEEEQIVNFNLCMATFACDDNGELFITRIRRSEPIQKLGDYPIIPADEAKELLKQGHFLTTVPADYPGMEYVRRVELIYRNGWDTTLLPYYRFYVEIPEMTQGERKTYGAYYVPAVEEQYIANMPLWDGSFN